jgi:RimJ/RimL family protein N-acetyltransferase
MTSEKVADWVIKHLPEKGGLQTRADFGKFQAIGVMVDDKPVAGVVYSNYRQLEHGADCCITIAASNPIWCQRSTLRYLFEYPFLELNCSRMTALIKEGNEKSIKLCAGLGFKREGVMQRGFDGRSNAILYGMRRDQCKWLKPEDRKF